MTNSAVEGSLSSTALFAYMTNPRTRDDFVKAPFESTVSKSGEPFFQYIMQPEHADVLQKVVAGVTPWLNVNIPILLKHPKTNKL